MSFQHRALCVTFCVLVAGITVGQTASISQDGPARVVAVGDVHGNFEGFAGILQAAAIIDAKQQWSGGKAVFVQTGDIYDRGDGVHQALDLMMRLDGEAKRAGGRVEPLLGNHEVMNILGEFRDVSPATFASFADGRSETRRVRAYDDLVKAAQRRGGDGKVPARDAWMAAHPPGFIEYSESLGPRGKYGRWIRSNKAVVAIGNTAFMHAGIAPVFQGSLDDVNRGVAADMAAWDAAKEAMVQADLIPPFATMSETIAAATAEIDRVALAIKEKKPVGASVTREYVEGLQRVVTIDKSSLLSADGPMWFRGFALWKETDEPPFTALLGRLGIGRFVAGHTPTQSRRITNRWDYRIFQIDTGMLGGAFFPGGRASALEIIGDRITAIYTDSREVIVAGRGQAQ